MPAMEKTGPGPAMPAADPHAILSGVGKIRRDCILCGAGEHDPVFTFTFDFLVEVRGQSEERLRLKGWSDDTTSTIVRCRSCGAHFVHDVITRSRENQDRLFAGTEDSVDLRAALRERMAGDTCKHYAGRDEENFVVRTLVTLAAQHSGRDIRFLDYGAGGGIVSNMARACGVRDVVAYDPNWGPEVQELFDTVNFPGIRCVRDKRDLPDLGPFAAAVFQSAIEHVLDPRGELQTIFDLLAPGGLLYVNNPVMDLGREIDALRSATRIRKSDRISYYHPAHLNYMLPGEFSDLLKGVGFELTPTVIYAPVPLARGFMKHYVRRNAKYAVRWLQNLLHLPYARHVYVVRKPAR